MAGQELNPTATPCLHMLSAFLAMEPTHTLLALARVCGEGSVTEEVQKFIWNHCISEAVKNTYNIDMNGKIHEPYSKNFLKKLIREAELSSCSVLDELYERYAHYMTCLKDDFVGKKTTRVNKCISFLFPDECSELSSCPKSRKIVVPLQCSLNMLEGDTGCSVWPSSLYLSEFILSFPELFANKSCFEVGSGLGLVGICLSHVKASEVILTDGDMSTLENMRINLEQNDLSVEVDTQKTTGDLNKVKCVHLPWESATEEQLQSFKPDIILGADVIYDPLCLPHLIRVLQTLLNEIKSNDNGHCSSFGSNGTKQDVGNDNGDGFEALLWKTRGGIAWSLGSRKGPLALIASVIRNIDTFNYFLGLTDKAGLAITDISEALKPINLLPYMQSYNSSDIRLFLVAKIDGCVTRDGKVSRVSRPRQDAYKKLMASSGVSNYYQRTK